MKEEYYGVKRPIDMAVAMRDLSAGKEERILASSLYSSAVKSINADKEKFLQQVHDALVFGMIMSYAQGLSMLSKASSVLEMEIPLQDVVRIWRGGCIIRSSLLEYFTDAYKKE